MAMPRVQQVDQDGRLSPVFISFCTPDYESEADDLISTLRRWPLDWEVYRALCRGSWDANTKIKTQVIMHAMKTYKRPIVYVDADARVQQNPTLFKELDCDVAYHLKDGRELLSGTLYFGYTEQAHFLLQKWEEENQKYPKLWDQVNLANVLAGSQGLVRVVLPAAYCQIFDSMVNEGEPIIEHFQASRRLRRKIGKRK